MSAMAQFRAEGEPAADGIMLAAAMEACLASLAVIERGRVLYANPAFAQMFGYSQSSEVHGRSLAEFIAGNGPAPGAGLRLEVT